MGRQPGPCARGQVCSVVIVGVVVQGADRALVKKEVDVAALHAASAQEMIDDGTGSVTVYRIIDVSMVRR